MKILMYGFGRGANIKLWLDTYQVQKEHQLFFACKHFAFKKKEYNNIKIYENVSAKSMFLKPILFMNLFLRKYDVVYIQGLYGFFVENLLVRFSKSKIKIINLWNNRNYKMFNTRLNQNLTYKKIISNLIFHNENIFERTNLIFINTGAVAEDFYKIFPKYKHLVKILPWGTDLNVINALNDVEYINEKLNTFTKNKFSILSPRSIITHNKQNLLLEAILKIRKQNSFIFQNICLVIMPGLSANKLLIDKYSEFVEINNLEKNVLIVPETIEYSKYLSTLKYFDLVVSLAQNDQFSGAIVEALYLKKLVMLSNIPEYIKFLNEYNLDVFLVENNSLKIAEEIIKIYNLIMRNEININNLERNKKIIENRLNFRKTFQIRNNIILKILNKDII